MGMTFVVYDQIDTNHNLTQFAKEHGIMPRFKVGDAVRVKAGSPHCVTVTYKVSN